MRSKRLRELARLKVSVCYERETPYVGFPLCLRQIHLSRVCERMGVSPVATGDLGRCPKNLRAFEKARPQLTDLVRRVK